MRRLSTIFSPARNPHRFRGVVQAWMSVPILLSLATLVLGSLPVKDRTPPQDRFISALKDAPAPTPLPKDLPKQQFFMEKSPVLESSPVSRPSVPVSECSPVPQVQRNVLASGFSERVYRPPRIIA